MKHLKFAENKRKKHLESFYKRNGSVIEFKIQDGTTSEAGKNGLQVTDILDYIIEVYKSLNNEVRCVENEITIGHLEQASYAQIKRTMGMGDDFTSSITCLSRSSNSPLIPAPA